MYQVSGLTVATTATIDIPAASLWNPHATQRIKVMEISIVAQAAPAAGAGLRLRRITTRGTAGSTVTPGIAQDSKRGAAPVSGVLLDLALYTVQPTLDTLQGWSWTFAAAAAAGVVYPCNIEIGPGAGLTIANNVATIFPVSQIGFSWYEDW